MPDDRKYHHGNLRQGLIDAAIQLIGDEGPGAFQLRAVARKAGVSPAAPYRHFRDKADLLQAVAGEVAQRLVQTTEDELDKTGDNPMMRFRAQGIAFVKFAVQHPAHFRVMMVPDVAASFEGHVQALTQGQDLLKEAIAESQRAGKLDPENQAAVALTARALIYGLARMLVDGHLGEDMPTVEQAEQLALAATEILGTGLIPRT